MKLGSRIIALALGLSLPSCTFIIDRSAEQCSTDSDCSSFPGTVCSAEKVCSEPACSTHQQCVEQLGPYHACKVADGVCIDMRSPECTVVEGDYAKEDAILFGVVVPTEGEAAEKGRLITNAVRLALREIGQTANGLPPAPGKSARRPLAFVGCNDDSDADTAVTAAKHLVSLGVPAIVGAAFSGITIKMATEATIPGGTLVISPSSTSVAITDLADDGLVWRTAPSDIYQAEALTLYAQTIQDSVRQQLSMQAGDKLRFAIVHKGDAYGSGLGRAVEIALQLNDAPALAVSNNGFYQRFDYGDPDNAAQNPPKYAAAIQAMLDMEPHIIFAFGTRESVLDVMAPIEAGWQSVSYRPRYVLSDGGVIPQLWSSVVKDDAQLRRRITGTIPGTTNPRFNVFRGAYNTQFQDGTSPDVFGAAGAYDAAYLLAYSTVASGAAQPTGHELASGLAKMVPPGQLVNAGVDSLSTTFSLLGRGESIDFNGASGPLDFNVETGEAPSDIQIWCMPANANGVAQSNVFSGMYLSATSGSLTGTIGAVCD
ncbi:ABC transporter substrate-binding protein [Chondromyces crocatus]|nr:ABC transporter substrate-binding protein [Chondromyces crocatus]